MFAKQNSHFKVYCVKWRRSE